MMSSTKGRPEKTGTPLHFASPCISRQTSLLIATARLAIIVPTTLRVKSSWQINGRGIVICTLVIGSCVLMICRRLIRLSIGKTFFLKDSRLELLTFLVVLRCCLILFDHLVEFVEFVGDHWCCFLKLIRCIYGSGFKELVGRILAICGVTLRNHVMLCYCGVVSWLILYFKA